MAENRIIKLGKKCDFQSHQIEHQIGAFTDCNHGCGLAVVPPDLLQTYLQRRAYKIQALCCQCMGYFGKRKTDEEIAFAGIDALAEFIKEIGLPTTLRELGMTDKSILPAIAASCNASSGSYGDMNKEKILEILNESF